MIDEPSEVAETSAGEEYLRRAEAAFRAGDYEEAVRSANHAIIEMPEYGKAYQFLSQALFAVGDYPQAAATAQQGMNLLAPAEWGSIVKNFRRYYRGTEYVKQMKRLEDFAKANPTVPYARFLLGYHYGFLGYEEAARRELAQTVELESRDEMAKRLLELFGGSVPASPSSEGAAPSQAEPNAPPEAQGEPENNGPPNVPPQEREL